jgi:hypothetical protein
MKKLLFAACMAALLTSCGSKSGEKEKPETTEKTETNKSQDNNLSTEMNAFMGKLNGSSDNVANALKEFGKDSLATNDMEMFNLEQPKVIETNGNCYLLRAKSGMTFRRYNLCWEGGKIVSVEDRGME